MYKLKEDLDGTTVENGYGIFIRDNGKLACRAPVSG